METTKTTSTDDWETDHHKNYHQSTLYQHELLTSQETTNFLRVSKIWLIRNRKSKHPIPYSRIGRQYLYERKKVHEWIKAHSIKKQIKNSD